MILNNVKLYVKLKSNSIYFNQIGFKKGFFLKTVISDLVNNVVILTFENQSRDRKAKMKLHTYICTFLMDCKPITIV